MNNDIITEWNSMSTEEQIKLITACVRKAANKDVGSYATSQHGHEINEFVNEAWERITNSLQPDELTACNKRRAAQGKEPITLVSMVYKSARAAVTTLCNREIKIANATDYNTDTDTCGTAYNMESAIITTVDLERFRDSRDAADQRILELVSIGYTEREIAAEIAISNVAVHKRIVKMRNELIKAIA